MVLMKVDNIHFMKKSEKKFRSDIIHSLSFMVQFTCNLYFRFASAKRDGSNYFVLLIITDGVITDMPQTIMSIVNVSKLCYHRYATDNNVNSQ